jgi:hypothetical protein
MSRFRLVVLGLVAALLAGAGCVPEAPPEIPVVTSTPTPTVTLIDLKSLLVPRRDVAVVSGPEYGDSRDIAEMIAEGSDVDETAEFLDRYGFVRGVHQWWLKNGVDRYVMLLQFTDEENAERYLRRLARSIGPVPGTLADIPGSRTFRDAEGTFFGVFYRVGVIVVDIRVFSRTPSTYEEVVGDLPQRQYELLADYA